MRMNGKCNNSLHGLNGILFSNLKDQNIDKQTDRQTDENTECYFLETINLIYANYDEMGEADYKSIIMDTFHVFFFIRSQVK